MNNYICKKTVIACLSLLIAIHCLSLRLTAQSVSWDWAVSAGGTNTDETRKMTTDPSGNVIVVGRFSQNITLTTTILTTAANTADAFVAKYTSAGSLLWAKKMGGAGSDPQGVSTDAAGNIYVSGTFKGTGSFDTISLTATGNDDVFVVKYSSSGSVLWARKDGGINSTLPFDQVTDLEGSTYVTGYGNNGTFGSFSLINSYGSGNGGYFLAKYSPAGSVVWARNSSCNGGSALAQSIATDADNNIIISGTFSGQMHIGSYVLTNSAGSDFTNQDIFIVKYTKNGTLLWARNITGSSYRGSFDLATDAAGSIYIAGYHRGTISFGSTSFDGNNSFSLCFLAKYDGTGNFVWVTHSESTNGGSQMIAVNTDASNYIYVSGSFYGSLILNNTTLASSPNGLGFIAKYTGDGAILDFFPVQAPLNTQTVSPTGEFYISGIYSGQIEYGSTLLTSVNNSIDIAIAKIGPGQTPVPTVSKLWDKTLGGTSFERLRTMITSSDGGYLLGGESNSNASGEKSQNVVGGSGLDFWLVKTDASGNKLWDKTYGGSLNDNLFAIVKASDGGYLLAGNSYSNQSGDKSENSKGDMDYWIIKTDASGNKLWDKTFGGTGTDRFFKAIATADGGFLLVGRSNSGISADKTEASRGDIDAWLVRIDGLGNKLWDKTIGGSGSDDPGSVAVLADGSFLLGLSSSSPVSGEKSYPSKGGADFWLVKLNPTGSKLWDKVLGGSHNEALYSINTIPGGDFFLAGRSRSTVSGDKSEVNRDPTSDYWVVRTDSLGNKRWDKTLGGDTLDVLNTSLVTADGGFVVGGYSFSRASFDKTEAHRGGGDFWVVRLDGSGNQLWDKTLGGTLAEEMDAMTLSASGDIIVGGYSFSSVSGEKSENSRGSADYWIARLQESFSGARKAAGPEKVVQLQQEPSRSMVEVYPNPFTNALQIQLPVLSSQPKVSIRIHDLLGREYLSKEFGFTNQNTISLHMPDSFAKGVYLLTVTHKDFRQVVRIVKQ